MIEDIDTEPIVRFAVGNHANNSQANQDRYLILWRRISHCNYTYRIPHTTCYIYFSLSRAYPLVGPPPTPLRTESHHDHPLALVYGISWSPIFFLL
jgi:hypothetical protein